MCLEYFFIYKQICDIAIKLFRRIDKAGDGHKHIVAEWCHDLKIIR